MDLKAANPIKRRIKGLLKALIAIKRDWPFNAERRYFMRQIWRTVYKHGSFHSNPDAGTEIHSIISKRDFANYLVAICSFLRFYQNITVVVHDDGTLTKKQRHMLAGIVKGIRIIGRQEADEFMKNRLSNYPYCRQFRSAKITMFQVFDFSAYAQKKKIVSLDSDTIFFDYPQEIIDWIEKENNEILHVYEKDPCVPCIKGKYITNIDGIPFKLAKNLCAGFVCCYSDIFQLDSIEKYCQFVLKNCDDNIKRYFAQGIMAMSVGSSAYATRPLSIKYQNPPEFSADQQPVFRHYWFSLGWPKEYLSEIRKVGREIVSFKHQPIKRKKT